MTQLLHLLVMPKPMKLRRRMPRATEGGSTGGAKETGKRRIAVALLVAKMERKVMGGQKVSIRKNLLPGGIDITGDTALDVARTGMLAQQKFRSRDLVRFIFGIFLAQLTL